MNEETRNKIKQITIFAKRMTNSSLTGDYLSAFKGSGLEFDQLREYQVGDDIRFIDWKSSAKKQCASGLTKLMIKQFVEERDRTIILAIDTSSSALFSSNEELRSATIAQVATVLACVATHNKDKVGALFFSDTIEKWIPPKRGLAHYGIIVNTLFSLESLTKRKKTDVSEALRFLISLKKRNAIVFLLSDWICDTKSYTKLLRVASIKFDLVGIRFLDSCERTFPNLGMIEIEDPETGDVSTIDTRKTRETKKDINIFLRARIIQQERLFAKYKIDLLDLIVGKPFITPMIEFFHQRTRRQI